MNFKPTLLKSLVSFISGVATNYFLAGGVRIQCMVVEGGTCPQPTWIEYAFNPGLIVISIAAIALVYSIWSFIQKK